MKIVYALQTCDITSNQTNKRFCCDTKQELIRKCVTSFLNSVKIAAAQHSYVEHQVMIIDDHSTLETVSFLKRCCQYYTRDNIRVDFRPLVSSGVMSSINECYKYLLNSDGDLVYQVQDDYLFEPSAVTETIDIFFRINKDTSTESIVTPYNAPYLWSIYYLNKTTPRTIFRGEKRYWIQIYDISCSFLTSKNLLIQNADILKMFTGMDPRDPELEKLSLNKILVNRGRLAVCPFESIALHMQSEYEKDPYVDWKRLWDSIDEDIITR